ncbi:MAG: hypothetical protein ACPGQI_01070, partial [Gammaproteobacteria bacterium]
HHSGIHTLAVLRASIISLTSICPAIHLASALVRCWVTLLKAQFYPTGLAMLRSAFVCIDA